MINAFTTDVNLEKTVKCGSKHIVLCAKNQPQKAFDNVNIEFYQLIDKDFTGIKHNNIYISSLKLDDNILDACIEHKLKNNANVIIDASRTLSDVGYFDVKYNLSPIMFAHRAGLLDNSTVVGGIYLDKDDVDLMVQSNSRLVLTPSFDSGYGNGIPPICGYIERGLKINLGSGDNAYNTKGDMLYEAQILKLLISASMNRQNAISDKQIYDFLHK